jgi:hypothetical protein
MTLIVETGSQVAGAESYCSVAAADAYHSGRRTAATWSALLTAAKEAALRDATDYLDRTYGGRWRGNRVASTQALLWPRAEVMWDDAIFGYRSSTVIPPELVVAAAELALRAASSALLADLGRETLSESVDVISVTYASGSGRQMKFDLVDRMLRPLLNGDGLQIVRS